MTTSTIPEALFAAATVRNVAGINGADLNPNTLQAWRANGLLELDRPNRQGWTRYTRNDLIRVAALAELSRFGLLSGNGGRALAAELERALLAQFASGELPAAPSYVIADQRATSGEDGAIGAFSGRPFAGLAPHFARMADDDHDACTTVAIDVAKLARRILRRMHELSGPTAS